MDITLCCELLNDVLQHPDLDQHRTVCIDHINSDWIGELDIATYMQYSVLMKLCCIACCASCKLQRFHILAQLLLVLGFLPHGHTLFLPDDNLDLFLFNAAVNLLRAMEFGIMRSAIITVRSVLCMYNETVIIVLPQ